MLTQAGDLAIAQLIFYLFAAPISVFIGLKHGFGRSAGWYFLIFLSVIRLAGSSLEIAVQLVSSPSVGLIAASIALESIGISPLTLATLAILQRLDEGLPWGVLSVRRYRLLGLLPIAGLIVSIVASVSLSSSLSSPSSGNSTDLSSAQAELEAGVGLFLATVVLEAGVAFLIWTKVSQIATGERSLLYAVVISLPFLLIRVIYSLLSAVNFQDPSSPFSRTTGSVYVQAFMSTLEEFVVVIVYLTAGALTPAISREELSNRHRERKQQGHRTDAGTFNPHEGVPLNGYSAPPYDQQQPYR